jgi:penicillin-binding protein 1A
MSLPIWALYYKKLYADETLNVSQEEFEKPENLSIRVDCDKKPTEGEEDATELIIEQVEEF